MLQRRFKNKNNVDRPAGTVVTGQTGNRHGGLQRQQTNKQKKKIKMPVSSNKMNSAKRHCVVKQIDDGRGQMSQNGTYVEKLNFIFLTHWTF